MELLTIGAFAIAARLSPKALRLYDELGLLRPASVDPASGYRLYSPAQLEQARLIAALRRLDMPLSRIGEVLRSGQAAAEVAAYWQEVEADVRARRELASFLIEDLTRKEETMRYAVLSHQGLVRESNQDSAYADQELLAVADGFGPDGQLASSAAIRALKSLDAGDDLLTALRDTVDRARRAFHQGTGTTLTALHRSGSRLALLHIGDSRVYLLRDGRLRQITHDHTLVQSMVDDGRLTAAEAATHPRRALLVKALHGEEPAVPDLEWRDTEPGDRYLLCSDGLYTSVATEAVTDLVARVESPDDAVRQLVELANRNGGADNVACVVADVP